MKSSLDSVTMNIPCPHCGKKLSETIGRLKTKTNLTCQHCGQAFDLDASELRREVAKVEKQLAKTMSAFGRLGK